MDIFELLAVKNGDWRKMAKGLLNKNNTNVCAPDDLVSDMYIKMHGSWSDEAIANKNAKLKAANEDIEDEDLVTIRDVMYGEEINAYYVYKAMRSCLMNRFGKQKRYVTESTINTGLASYARNTLVEQYTEVQDLNDDVDATNRELVMKDFLDEVMESLDSMYWFDAKLLKVYLVDNHSMRSLADKSKISLTTIFHNLKSTKTKLKVEFMPSYIEILNQLGEVDEADRVQKEYDKLMEEMNGSQIDIFQVIKEETKKTK